MPVHYTAFHPDYKLNDLPRTPAATLSRARQIAQDAGLQYVYTGNVHDERGGSTYCPQCHAPLILRDWYRIDDYRLTADGRCPDCATAASGHFEAFRGAFGPRRIPIRLRKQ